MHPLLSAYANRLVRLKRDPKTLKSFRNSVAPLERWAEERGIKIDQLQPYQLEEFFAESDYAISTQKLQLSHIRAAFRYAQRRGMAIPDPTVDIILPRERNGQPRIIPTSDLRRIRDNIESRQEELLFHFLAYTGMRRTEIRTIRGEDLDLANASITVVGKFGKLRYVPIHPALGELLPRVVSKPYIFPSSRRRETPRPFSDRHFGYLVERLTEGEYTPHDFRRTVSSSLKRNGVDERVIDRILGWGPETVFQRYYLNVADEELQQAILKLYADDPL